MIERTIADYQNTPPAGVTYNFRLEWDIDTGHQAINFMDYDKYADYLNSLREAERQGMCTGIKKFRRRVVTEEWEEFLS